jgi:rSAM/selenodomain-associated transferase 2/rSAM/selenodomain-associated transferase 1
LKFSVVIPALNEAGIICQRIAHVRSLRPDVEIVVADGGSTDNTLASAGEQNVLIATSEPGRGIQCNAGAAIASGDILVFLHADTELPEDAFVQLEEYFANDNVQIGTFKLSFDMDHWLLRLYCLPSELNLAFTRFGDQCIVVRKSFFLSLGGFPGWRLFEDLALTNRARKQTRIYRFPGKVRTSARRFIRNGIIRQQVLNIWYTLQYFMGVSPDELAGKYEDAMKRKNLGGVVVFSRFPHVGRVKSRLAKSLGAEKATEVYRLCAENIFRECERLCAEVCLYVFFDDEKDTERGARWAGPKFTSHAQAEGDLGQRLAHAFKITFNRGVQKVVLLASDVPDITSKVISDAIHALDSNDVVIGPCHDGGYYLIGMKKSNPELFDNISWSTEHVYKQTMAIIRKSGLQVCELPELIDIDTEEDLLRWLEGKTSPKNPALRSCVQKIYM